MTSHTNDIKEAELDKILEGVYNRAADNNGDATVWYRGAPDYTCDEAKQALLAWGEAYAKEVRLEEINNFPDPNYVNMRLHELDLDEISSADSKEVKDGN